MTKKHDDDAPQDLKSAGKVDEKIGMTQVRAGTPAKVRMVKDESVLEIDPEDVAAHARMGFKLSGE